ncbi:hypothetical protein ASPWEDRAFT_27806 [Aspergillus wentii DTO 134E9]|uniref:Uncharacterized protein n=1 Tax=Aspergillus wentii DTO 134E9 TaxID=1073089 RepID=A0A1L9RJQ0_ASPWE|nr:uncharacterized protein ASPWEDRAFT_27806 [Aspergillus wentii DTO 134E9]KAI9931910.1 hypothetical protein MW887_009411 [Aspergillus wentii]OJJ35133.1 hypothetical protein ASPWEDRAFT_27806 [Aspergillus wentii DTO 134E9]
MPSNTRLPPQTPKLHSILVPRLPRVSLLPIRSILQPAVYTTPNSVRARFSGSSPSQWKGSNEQGHAVNRAKGGDTTDPTTEASYAGMKNREESEGIADNTKSEAETERGGLKHQRKAKEEHPNAPEPIIGMNDERGQKGK